MKILPNPLLGSGNSAADNTTPTYIPWKGPPEECSQRHSWERLWKEVQAAEEEVIELRERADRKERWVQELKAEMRRALGGQG